MQPPTGQELSVTGPSYVPSNVGVTRLPSAATGGTATLPGLSTSIIINHYFTQVPRKYHSLHTYNFTQYLTNKTKTVFNLQNYKRYHRLPTILQTKVNIKQTVVVSWARNSQKRNSVDKPSIKHMLSSCKHSRTWHPFIYRTLYRIKFIKIEHNFCFLTYPSIYT